MNKFFLIAIAITSALCQAEYQYRHAPGSKLYFPKLTFTYDWKSNTMDKLGGLFFRNNGPLPDKNDVAKKMPALIAAWEKQAPELFNALFAFTKRGFKAQTRTALVYATHEATYASKRILVLGLRDYLDNSAWTCPISKEDSFVSLVFHELLHVWLGENLDTSPILKKYHGENKDVREHIHTYALQKMVYQKLNRPDILADIDEQYTKHAPTEYKRAWNIVNTIEGHDKVLKDLLENLKPV